MSLDLGRTPHLLEAMVLLLKYRKHAKVLLIESIFFMVNIKQGLDISMNLL